METPSEPTPKIPVKRRVLQLYECLINQMVDYLQGDYDPEDNLRRKAMLDLRSTLTSRNQLLSHNRKQKSAAAKLRLVPDVLPLPEAWKTDIAAFAAEALHIELYEHQKQLCRSQKRVNILIAGRGAGKSMAARVKALHDAVCNPGHTVLVVSSVLRMSCDFGEKLQDIIRNSQIQDRISSITQEEITFKNGSVIKFLPSNPDTIRGYHPKPVENQGGMTVILDEACFMEQGSEIRKAVEYALITTPKEKGSIWIVSSPSSIASWVYEYVQKSENEDSDIAVFNCPSFANPSISPEELERLKATKNEIEYRAEVLGEWTDSAYGLFSGLIEPNMTDFDYKTIPKNTTYSIGADLALSFSLNHDRNAVALMAKLWPHNPELEEPSYLLMDIIALDLASDKEVRYAIKNLKDKYRISNIAIEQYQGKSLAEYCQDHLKMETQLVCPTPGLQQTIFHEMHRLLRQGKLILPKDLPELFFNELKTFEYKREASGTISFGHPNSGKHHDDTVYAAAWALHAARLVTEPYEPYNFPPMIKFIPRF